MLRVLRSDGGSFPLLIMSTSVRKVTQRTKHIFLEGTACNVIRAVITSYVSYISSALSRERQHTILYNILFSLMDKEQKKKIS